MFSDKLGVTIVRSMMDLYILPCLVVWNVGSLPELRRREFEEERKSQMAVPLRSHLEEFHIKW
jgi:hypothetical protein